MQCKAFRFSYIQRISENYYKKKLLVATLNFTRTYNEQKKFKIFENFFSVIIPVARFQSFYVDFLLSYHEYLDPQLIYGHYQGRRNETWDAQSLISCIKNVFRFQYITLSQGSHWSCEQNLFKVDTNDIKTILDVFSYLFCEL